MVITEQHDFKELMLKYEFAKKRLETELDILLDEYKFKNGYNPVEHTKSRIKSLDSIVKKIERKGFDISVDSIQRYVHDVVGVRIICSFLSDVYDIINIIKSSRQFIIKREIDYIKNPKESGYTSYHINLLVPVHLEGKTEYIEAEVQIRTIAMDCWASLDHKLRYKLSNTTVELENEMYACADKMVEIDKQMQHLCEMVRNLRK